MEYDGKKVFIEVKTLSKSTYRPPTEKESEEIKFRLQYAENVRKAQEILNLAQLELRKSIEEIKGTPLENAFVDSAGPVWDDRHFILTGKWELI